MITNVSQRGRVFIPPDDRFTFAGYHVELSQSDAEVKAFVRATHYSGSYPLARERAVMRESRSGRIVAAAVLSQPMSDGVLAPLAATVQRIGATLAETTAELGRFVLTEELAFNAESSFIREAFALFHRAGWRAVLAFADPEPRADAHGRRVFRGHIGQIYRATNAIYAGKSTPRTNYLLPDGSVFNARAVQKIRARERNWQSAAAELERHGAEHLDEDADSRAWLARWMPRLCRRFRHRGNLRYLFGLDRRVRRFLPAGEPYPRITIAA